ncbi:ABC-2 type transport system ATP-binding protein [Kytococcus aerolatus]|uniref:ABC-2 type transport system ATP-binding protein n=1 Tax=Kytococcus aerolatus TaxID=592308 RepID=A0A212TDS1_9MICO|nr:ATP-binding cassette domain-containing protein [Kytococcus aerolatus]SNC64163.1 ABC-2 type transport system ATP-binding protein [Kytococcus aerolatus]
MTTGRPSTGRGGWEVRCEGVTCRYDGTTALDGVDVTFRPGVITGLVGRNGAGKSTLARCIAAWERPRDGRVLVDGAPVWEDAGRTSRVVLAGTSGPEVGDQPVRVTLDLMESLRPDFDRDLFQDLTARIGAEPGPRPNRLSTGQAAAFRGALALAAQAEVTILDEVHLGMDAVSRRRFGRVLLEEYVRRPRTIIVSSHLLDEVEDVLEDVVVLHRGRVLATGSADELRERHSRGRLASLTDVLEALTEEAR